MLGMKESRTSPITLPTIRGSAVLDIVLELSRTKTKKEKPDQGIIANIGKFLVEDVCKQKLFL